MRYLITCGAGFIGSHLADRLVGRGDEVLAVDEALGRLEAEDGTFVSPGVVILEDGGKAAAIRDPDGQMIVLRD